MQAVTAHSPGLGEIEMQVQSLGLAGACSSATDSTWHVWEAWQAGRTSNISSDRHATQPECLLHPASQC